MGHWAFFAVLFVAMYVVFHMQPASNERKSDGRRTGEADWTRLNAFVREEFGRDWIAWQ